MDSNTYWAIVAVVFTTVAFGPYVWQLWKAEDELNPAISGWVSWSLSDAAILAAQLWTAYTEKDWSGVGWQNAVYVLGPVVIVWLSMRKGILLARRRHGTYHWQDAFRDWVPKDTICVSIVAAAVLVWGYKHDPEYAIYLTVFSTVIATWAVAWPLRLDPYREHLWAWLLFLLGGIGGVLAVWDKILAWDITNGLPPVLFIGVQLTMVILTARRYLPRYRLVQI